MTVQVRQIFALPKNVLLPTSIVSTLLLFVAGSMFTVAKSVWNLSESISEFKYSIDKRFDFMERKIENMNENFTHHKRMEWDAQDMERWTYFLEKNNRHLQLCVPDVAAVKSEVRK